MSLEHRRSWRAVARFLPLLLAAVSLGAQESGRPRGRLFIVGGGTQPPALVKEFVDLAGGARARIVVFAMASASGLTSGEAKAADLRKLGATAINVHVNSTQANTDS